MQRQTSVVLATLAVLAATAAYLWTRPQEAGMRRLDFAALSRTGIDRIELSGEHNVLLRQEGGRWILGSGRAADVHQARHAIDALMRLNTSDFVTDDAERAKALGLDTNAQLRLRAFGGGQLRAELTLAPSTGEVGPAGAMGLVARGSEVFAEAQGLYGTFNRSEGELEDRAVVAFGSGDVRSFAVAPDEGPAYTLHREAEGWRPAPAEGAKDALPALRFDGQQAEALAARLTSARALRLVDADPGAQVTGLAPEGNAWLRWQVAPEGAAAPTAGGLQLGKAAEGGGVWAKATGRALPFVLDDATANGLRPPLRDLADLTLMARVNFDDVVGLRLQPKPGQTLVFAREDDAWVTRRADGMPKGFAAKAAPLKVRMRQASLARAIGLVPEAERAKVDKTFKAQKVLQLITADKKAHVLRVGQAATWRGGPAFLARGDADEATYYVSRPLVENLFGKLAELDGGPATARAAGARPPVAGPQGLDSLPPEVQESIRKQLAGAAPRP